MATVDSEAVTPTELQLAARNHGFPLEALRHDVTPAGLHYLLIHYDIPPAPPDFTLHVGGLVRDRARTDPRRSAGSAPPSRAR